MAKLNLQEQTRSTRYGQSDEENFEDFVVKPSLKVSGRIVLLHLEQLVEYKDFHIGDQVVVAISKFNYTKKLIYGKIVAK